ncbi:MBL fold metallo-hydrolase [Bacillus sp. B15-48]|uniref:MBL fold metallo-hydrolase n=1 Tax=Bacillus sp. B15-48 TaxID=1548601 RepID=UPI00193FB368|nr:MBL fold metallo-hydrolase [Bacillus sp. B15-48]MBM4765248.1 MBL fold metallo-hydrolase [Bacillus sp. B15-48]
MDNRIELNSIAPLTKITENIYKLTVRYPFGMFELNSYLIYGDQGFTVIDTGSYADESITLWKNLMDSGVKIEKIVVTHTHPDHIGLCRWFQGNYQIPVFVSDLGYKEIQKNRDHTVTNWTRKLFKEHNGPALPEDIIGMEAPAYRFEPDGLFQINEPIKLGNDMYEVIWTPGHAHDHLCFYEPKQEVMILGDLVFDHLSPIVAIWSEEDGNVLKDYFQSLDKVKAFSPKQSLPGHGIMIEDLAMRVEETKSRHQHRLEQVVDCVKQDEKTSYQICQEVYGGLSFYKLFAPFMSTISRMVYLESIGKVKSVEKNGIIYYRANI